MELFDYQKLWCLPTSLHGFTTQKANIDILTAAEVISVVRDG